MTSYASVDLVATTTSQPILSPGGSQSFTITKAQAFNAGSGSGTVKAYRTPAGGVPSTNNVIVPSRMLTAASSSASIFQISGQVVENGKQLWVQASGTNAAITVSISYAIN